MVFIFTLILCLEVFCGYADLKLSCALVSLFKLLNIHCESTVLLLNMCITGLLLLILLVLIDFMLFAFALLELCVKDKVESKSDVTLEDVNVYSIINCTYRYNTLKGVY